MVLLSNCPRIRMLFTRPRTVPPSPLLHYCSASYEFHQNETHHLFFPKHIRPHDPVTATTSCSFPATYESNARLRYFVKSELLQDARQLFDGMLHRDEISWTIIIAAYVNATNAPEALALFSRMWSDPTTTPDPFVLSLALKACGSSPILRWHGESIHGYTVKSGTVISSVFVGSALLDMYSKTGPVDTALQVFYEMPQRNVVSWTAAITALVRAGHHKDAVRCFGDMWASRVPCDSYTFAIALKACADSGQLARGREIHTQAVKRGLDATSFVANSLCTMYSKCGMLARGLTLFERMTSPDVVSWTSIISTYLQMGREDQAIRAFLRMWKGEVRPNEYTYAAAVSACAGLAQVTWGEQLHAHVTRAGVVASKSVSNALVTMYSRAGRLASAHTMFRDMTSRDIVSWSAMISGYAQEGHVEGAFELLAEMRSSGPQPNEYTLASLLSVCAFMAMLELGRQVHTHVMALGLQDEAMVASALIKMYSKCGTIEEAGRIFDGLKGTDVVSWTAMIGGYAEHGHSGEAVDLFERMGLMGLRPDYVTLIGVLGACSHAGLVGLGFHYFNSMRGVYGIEPGKEHYGCMVDLLCRAGRLQEAKEMILSMPGGSPDDVVWSTLLRACRVHGDADCGRRTAERILELQPGCASTHVTLSNIYAAGGRWRDAAEMRKLMRSKGVRKEPGWSWIMAGSGEEVSVFVAGDRRHPKGEEIYAVLRLLAAMAKMAGYVPDITSSLQSEAEDEPDAEED